MAATHLEYGLDTGGNPVWAFAPAELCVLFQRQEEGIFMDAFYPLGFPHYFIHLN